MAVLDRRSLWVMTLGAGLVVANNYYNQPLLALIAAEFRVSEASVGAVAVATQLGYAAGLFFLVPLADMFHRKRLILSIFPFIITSLLLAALSWSLTWLVIASFLIGLTSIIPQLFVPLAATLAAPKEKSRSIGMVMSGLLIGVLASRIISGIIGEYLGWRYMFFIGALVMALFFLLVARTLPEVKPSFNGSYPSLMRSLIHYLKKDAALRLASWRGGCSFGAFTAFWTTLVFHLEGPPFHAGSGIAGAFGILGIAGALVPAFLGKVIDRIDRGRLIISCSLLALFSWWLIGGPGTDGYPGLILGVLLIDLALQAVHLINQSIIFTRHPEATNRVNTIYMTSYFIGGSLGTFLAAVAWDKAGWSGVTAVGALFMLAMLAGQLLFYRKTQ